jgi:hypothetical protein
MARSGIQIGQLQLKNGSLSGSLSSEAYVLQQESTEQKKACARPRSNTSSDAIQEPKTESETGGWKSEQCRAKTGGSKHENGECPDLAPREEKIRTPQKQFFYCNSKHDYN